MAVTAYGLIFDPPSRRLRQASSLPEFDGLGQMAQSRSPENASLPGNIWSPEMNSKARDLIISNGRRIIGQIQKLMGRYSLIGDHEFFGAENFPWSREVEENWRDIREELDQVMQHREDLPNFQDISPDQKDIANDDKWKTFFFFAYGLRSEDNLRRCPKTARLLDRIPGAKTAFFSILTGRKHIPEHTGPTKALFDITSD